MSVHSRVTTCSNWTHTTAQPTCPRNLPTPGNGRRAPASPVSCGRWAKPLASSSW
ncbi:hypothetical protein L915_09598 [Phytophthora nicotianae]|uniref:Uncharacterized protein n=1 Tax=Phytophthora nicotianae TaxID=4792 RepID=W2GTN6_PHYNI|nr:hypothetical protein L915_09598 [Phytophthora nicotianae]